MMHEEIAGNTGSAALLARVQSLIGADLREVERIFVDEIASRHPFAREVLGHMAGWRYRYAPSRTRRTSWGRPRIRPIK